MVKEKEMTNMVTVSVLHGMREGPSSGEWIFHAFSIMYNLDRRTIHPQVQLTPPSNP